MAQAILRTGNDQQNNNILTSVPMSVYHKQDAQTKLPIVINTGASISVTPNLSNFIGPLDKSEIDNLGGLSGGTAVSGKGTVKWTIRDYYGRIATIKTTAYYVPNGNIRLMSPQTYFQEQEDKGNYHGALNVTSRKVVLVMPEDKRELEFPFQPRSNLPMMLPQVIMEAGLVASDTKRIRNQELLAGLFGVVSDQNLNLNAAQKELLKWHQKLGHSHFAWNQFPLA